jgi:hypothetical protein
MAVITSLIAYWSLGEASGNALDSHGSNHLTETSGTIDATAGKVGGCRDFEAGDTEYFEIADNVDLSTGDVDWTWAGWVNAETLAANPVIAHKGWINTPDGNSEWILFYNTSTSRFNFVKRVAASVTLVATTFGAASTGTWYFVVMWHDAVNNLMGISINDGTADTTSSSTGLNDGNRAYQIGASSLQALYWDGLIDEVGFWKKVLTSGERTWLYNSGNGRSYADIVAEAGGGAKPWLYRRHTHTLGAGFVRAA